MEAVEWCDGNVNMPTSTEDAVYVYTGKPAWKLLSTALSRNFYEDINEIQELSFLKVISNNCEYSWAGNNG